MSLDHWIWLQQVLGYGSERVSRVLERYGSPEELFGDCRGGKVPAGLFSDREAARLHTVTRETVNGIAEAVDKDGLTVIPYPDPRYPARLKSIPNPPLLLYVRGTLPEIDRLPAVTVVGPRKASDYGEKAAFSLARRLAAAGCLIVSGGAVGIDGMAHLGAMSAGMPTVAVLGCGTRSHYPKGNEALREKISSNGCLLTEYPPDFPPSKVTYPQRNRVLAAISCGTVVVEAGEKSGALITASCAAEQGRDVFVIPGNPSLAQYAGSNRLLKDGAKPVLTASDVLEEYYPLFRDIMDLDRAASITCGRSDLEAACGEAKTEPPAVPAQKPDPAPAKPAAPPLDPALLSPTAAALYAAPLPAVFTADEAANLSGVSGGDLLAALTELELFGGLTALPGGRYQKP